MAHDWLQLCEDIDDGEVDDGLDEIAKAVSSRIDIVRRRNARRMMRDLKVGDRVKLTNGVKPRYLEGMVGEIQKIDNGVATVKLDKMPSHSGAGRPPEGGYKDRLKVVFAFLQKIDDDGIETLDASAIGDDSDEDDDDDD